MKLSILRQIVLGAIALLSIACGQSANNNEPMRPASNTGGNSAATPAGTTSGSQRVTFESADKTVIVGTLLDAAATNSPAILLLHQWKSDRHSYDDFAKRMHAKGFAVLSIDGRGFGESVKTTDGKTVAEPSADEAVKDLLSDVGAAFDYLSKKKNVDANRVGIIGASYGSSLAIMYAAENPKVKSVALLSPGLNYFEALPTEPAVKKYGDRALLLVAATGDGESPDAVSKLKAAGANDKYEVKIYDKGGHGTALFDVGLGDLLEQFLTASL